MSARLITDEELDGILQSMPASPRLLAELGPKLEQVEVPLAEITALLRRDAMLTARLIAIANSAVYARAEPATSLEEAVASIGYSEVYRLVGALAAAQLADEPLHTYGVESHRYRENALFVALVMEELAAASVDHDPDPRTAYTVGLLRSIGKVALDRHGRRTAPASTPLGAGLDLVEWERSNWGCSNAELAARILTGWRFPDPIVHAVRDHYAPTGSAHAMSHLLNLCAGAADLRGFGLPGEESYWQFTPTNFECAGVDEGRLVWAGERAFQTLQRIMGALA